METENLKFIEYGLERIRKYPSNPSDPCSIIIYIKKVSHYKL